MASSLRQRGPGDPVLERLDELRRDSIRAERVYTYVATGHDTPVKVQDFLHVLRDAPDLALELRANTGRIVIAAVEDDSGTVRYREWCHDAVSAKADNGSPVQSARWQRRDEVTDLIENRSPRIRFREDTPLADLDAPSRFRGGPGRTYRGP